MAKRSLFRRVLGAGVLAGAAYALWRAIEANKAPAGEGWEPQPFPFPPQPRSTAADAPASAASRPATKPTPAPAPAPLPEPKLEPWVEPVDGACPASHPVKAKLSSGIFHVVGGQMYDRTTPDRCYVDTRAAVADGMRQSKR